MRGNILWTIFLTLCLAVLSVVGIFYHENGFHKPVPREIIVEHEEQEEREIIPAMPDYSSFTEPVIDRNGKLNIPNNTTISDVSTRTICTELCEFEIPESWVDHVVIHVMKMDQKDKELYSDPVLNTEVVQIYEKNTYMKYQSQEYYYSDYANYMGKLCEIYITDNKENKTEKIKENPYELYFADLTKNRKTYSAFLYQFLLNDRVIDPELEDEYRSLSNVDYPGCIISSMKSDKVEYANSYIKDHYVDGFDPNGPGIRNTEKAKPEKLVHKVIGHDAEVPQALANIEQEVVYEWPEFASPFFYEDHGNRYPYAAMESGGQPVARPTRTATPTPESQIDIGMEEDVVVDGADEVVITDENGIEVEYYDDDSIDDSVMDLGDYDYDDYDDYDDGYDDDMVIEWTEE